MFPFLNTGNSAVVNKTGNLAQLDGTRGYKAYNCSFISLSEKKGTFIKREILASGTIGMVTVE
jgi:hypothetical protein